jgi:hypothetical protein
MQGTDFLDFLNAWSHTASTPGLLCLVNLLLLVDAIFARSAVDKEQESPNNGENLEEIVLGEIFVGVVLMELGEN